MNRYLYTTTLPFGDSKAEVTVSYRVVWSGSEPSDSNPPWSFSGDEIDGIRLEKVNGAPWRMVFTRFVSDVIEQLRDSEHYEAMIVEAVVADCDRQVAAHGSQLTTRILSS